MSFLSLLRRASRYPVTQLYQTVRCNAGKSGKDGDGDAKCGSREGAKKDDKAAGAKKQESACGGDDKAGAKKTEPKCPGAAKKEDKGDKGGTKKKDAKDPCAERPSKTSTKKGGGGKKTPPSDLTEPTEPKICSDKIPGPESTDLSKELNSLQQAESVVFFADYQNAIGSYLADADGNMILDLFGNIGSIPVGYNHPRILELFRDEKNLRTLVNRPALGYMPDKVWPDKLQSVLMSVSPGGLPHVFTMACGSCSNENALKCAFFTYMVKKRGEEFTQEEIATCMSNQPPGCPKLSILSFKGGFHGRTFGALTCSTSKVIHKIGAPAFEWPAAPFPRYQYPLDCFLRENKAEDKRCLEEVENIISQHKKFRPVAGVIVEPIQSEGGDHHGSPEFFRELQKICKKHKASLIMDEVATGCGASGKMWCHEHFDLEGPPDIVTFSKKMQLGGFFHAPDIRPKHPFRIFNTWMGDPGKMIILEEVLNIITEENLLDHVTQMGDYIMAGLRAIEKEFPDLLTAPRGRGTFMAFNLPDTKTRNKVVQTLLLKGIQVGNSGENTIRIRPALTLKETHADVFLDRLRTIVCELVGK